MGFQSAENLKNSINKSKRLKLDRFIYSLGIRHIGQENAKLLAKHLKYSDNFFKLQSAKNMDELSNIDGIGETQTKSIKNFFSNKINLEILEELETALNIKNVSAIKKNGILKNKSFLVTGKLDGISRAEIKSLIEENSGISVSSVSKKLDYLIAGNKPTKRKIDSAKELKISIITQDEFLNMLNKVS